MHRLLSLRAVLLGIVCSVPVGGLSKCAWTEPAAEMAILKAYCTACHGAQKPKADLVLEMASVDFPKQATLWTTVLERVSDGTMPPADKPQPTAEERRTLAGWIRSGLANY